MGRPYDKSLALVQRDPVLPTVLHTDLLLWTDKRCRSKLASWQPSHHSDGFTCVLQSSDHRV